MADPIPFRNPKRGSSLNSSDGGGSSDIMEARVARLEADMAELKADVKALRSDNAGIKVDLAEIKGKLAHAPTYPGLFAMCGTLVAVIGAVIAVLVRFLPAAP